MPPMTSQDSSQGFAVIQLRKTLRASNVAVGFCLTWLLSQGVARHGLNQLPAEIKYTRKYEQFLNTLQLVCLASSGFSRGHFKPT